MIKMAEVTNRWRLAIIDAAKHWSHCCWLPLWRLSKTRSCLINQVRTRKKRKKQANIWTRHTSWEEKWSGKGFRDGCLRCTCQQQSAGFFSDRSSSSSSSSPFVQLQTHWSSFQRSWKYFQNHWRTFWNIRCFPPHSRCLILHKHTHRRRKH